MNRASLTVRLARRLQALPLWLFQFVEWPFVWLWGRREKSSQSLFLLALPRSGSTATYQVICHGLDVQYLSNLWNLLYQLPLLGGWLSARRSRRHQSTFQSQHGFVPGLDGPAEGLRFWRWWLDCGLSDESTRSMPAKVLQRRVGYLNRVLDTLTRHGRPFVSAYLGHVLVPDRLHKAFEGAALIRLQRDPVSNALSLLKSVRSGPGAWFSVVPEECAGLESASEHERVAAQVYWLNRRLDEAACQTDMLTVRYETLCQNPADELARIQSWCRKRGIEVEGKWPLPERFNFNVADVENDPDAHKIHQAFSLLEERHGKLKGPAR
ncbi:MAG: sulfotransferase [Pseudomonadota bacterium]